MYPLLSNGDKIHLFLFERLEELGHLISGPHLGPLLIFFNVEKLMAVLRGARRPCVLPNTENWLAKGQEWLNKLAVEPMCVEHRPPDF